MEVFKIHDLNYTDKPIRIAAYPHSVVAQILRANCAREVRRSGPRCAARLDHVERAPAMPTARKGLCWDSPRRKQAMVLARRSP